MKKILCCLVGLVSSFSLYPGWTNEGFQTYSDDYNHFSISIPGEKWRFTHQYHGSDPVKVKISYFQTLDQFTPNITLSLSTLKDPKKSLKKIMEGTLKEYPEELKVVSKSLLQSAEKKGFDVILKDEKVDMQFFQRFLIHKEKIFVLTFSARTNSFKRLEGEFLRIFDSFSSS